MLRELDIENEWQAKRWPHFSPKEFACRHCQEVFIWPAFLDKLQCARGAVAKPFHILSGHRCSLHNARVGGAPLSQHLTLAVDIALTGHDPERLLNALKRVEFRGFGFYQTFLHVDLGPSRHWFGGKIAKSLWQIYLA